MLNIDESLLIVRHLGGVKLIGNKKNKSENLIRLNARVTSVADILSMSFNVYMQNMSNRIISINDACVSSFGLPSKSYALGNKLECIYRDELHLQNALANDKIVIDSKEFSFFNESFLLPDQTEISNFLLKLPLFNERDCIIGLLAFGVNSSNVSNKEFSEHLTNLIKTFTVLFHGHLPSNSPLYVIPDLFTTREFEVIHWVVRGKTMREIASIMRLSTRTVESYFDKIKKKVGVSTKSQFIALAIT